jgi:hypothetical protein
MAAENLGFFESESFLIENFNHNGVVSGTESKLTPITSKIIFSQKTRQE